MTDVFLLEACDAGGGHEILGIFSNLEKAQAAADSQVPVLDWDWEQMDPTRWDLMLLPEDRPWISIRRFIIDQRAETR